MKKYNICSIVNGHNYAIELGILIVSILLNSEKDECFSFHIITDDMSDDDKNKILQLKEIKNFDIKFYKPDVEKYKKWYEEIKDRIYYWWNYIIFVKLDIPEILKDLDTVLFLDTDMIVLKSLKEIFNTDISNYWLLAAKNNSYLVDINNYSEEYIKYCNMHKLSEDELRERCKEIKEDFEKVLVFDKEPHEWVNSGFMYMNLKELRANINKADIDKHIIKLFETKMRFGHEAILNHFVPNDKIKKVSEYYNVIFPLHLNNEYADKTIIAHFNADHRIVISPENKKYSNYIPSYKNKLLLSAWEYLSYTPWFKENTFYWMDMFLKYDKLYLERYMDKKIDKIIDFLVWPIPFRNMRDKTRKKLKDIQSSI